MPYQKCKACTANLLTPRRGACYFDLGIAFAWPSGRDFKEHFSMRANLAALCLAAVFAGAGVCYGQSAPRAGDPLCNPPSRRFIARVL